MSLLLDALKKAEQAKRDKAAADANAAGAQSRGADSGAGPGGPQAPPGLSLEPMSDAARAAEQDGSAAVSRPGPRTEQRPSGGPEAPFDPDDTVNFEVTPAGFEAGGRGDKADTLDIDLDEFARELADSRPAEGESEPRPDFTDTGVTGAHTMPSLKSVRSSLRDFYGDTLRGPAVQPGAGTPPPGPAAGLDTIGAATTQVSSRAARTVFDAKRPPPRKGPSRLALLTIGGGALAILLVVAYYATQVMTTVQPTALRVSPGAVRTEAARPPLPPAAPPVSREPALAATTPGAEPAGAAAPPPPTAPELPSAPAGVPSMPAGAPETPVVATAPPVDAVRAPAPPAPAAAASSQIEDYRLALQTQPRAVEAPVRAAPAVPQAPAGEAPLARTPAADPAPRQAPPAAAREPVSIARTPPADRTYAQLQDAYVAFQAGDVAGAAAVYRSVLAREPRNRDALLGAAAVAVRAGRTQEAVTRYRQVLQLNPRDQVALAALSGMRATTGAPQSESQLKLLLEQDPGSPYLHFSLGNLYAAQGRWSEAQQAYFNAYRSDGRNADYAFNLAVSLDQLGQRRTALEFYRRALELAERQSATFDTSAVRQRVEALVQGGV